MPAARRPALITAAAAVMISVLTSCASAADSSGDRTVRAELGKRVDIRSNGSPMLASMWLDSVEPVTCSEPGSLPPNNGNYLAVTIVLHTTEDYEPDWGWWMSAPDFATMDEDGDETGKGVLTSCLPGHRYLPDDFYMQDAGYYGVVLLDSSSQHGTLTYRPHNMPADVPGWQWSY
ncbi:MAG: hypothetical protein M3548_10490 [Actinomycetota bacterium]|nr:hypothetical protein [Actinomycetota bacterium]